MNFPVVRLPYEDFVLNEVIDPEEFDINNHTLLNAINDLNAMLTKLTESTVDGDAGANHVALTPIEPFTSTDLQSFLEEFSSRLQSSLTGAGGSSFVGSSPITGLSGITVRDQIISTKLLIDAARSVSTQLEQRLLNNYYTKSIIDSRLIGGDTVIKQEVFRVITPDTGDGTFIYMNKDGVLITGVLTEEGYQVFKLVEGVYDIGENRIEAHVHDVLYRSAVSGGLMELSRTEVALTAPEEPDVEVTFKYYERLGLVGEHANAHAIGQHDEVPGLVKVGGAQPKSTSGAIWFKVIS